MLPEILAALAGGLLGAPVTILIWAWKAGRHQAEAERKVDEVAASAKGAHDRLDQIEPKIDSLRGDSIRFGEWLREIRASLDEIKEAVRDWGARG